MTLFLNIPFVSHAGKHLDWKIECDALSDEDIQTIAAIVAKRFCFSRVIGIPRGGLRLATALEPYCIPGFPVLIVDDVLTTGASMEEMQREVGNDTVGFVIFARGKCPEWIAPLFQLSESFQNS